MDRKSKKSVSRRERSDAEGKIRNIGTVEGWGRRMLDPRSWRLDAERMGKEKKTGDSRQESEVEQ
jgi:hypothetical protein